MNYSTVDIIICTYNNKDIIGECLDHVQALHYENKKCIVIDDCSTDNTIKIIQQDYPWVRVITKEKNSGPSISRNIAISQSSSKYIMFLDSDVLVEPFFLNNLMERMKQRNDKNISICGGKLLLNNGRIDSTGGGIAKIGVGFDKNHKMPDEGGFYMGEEVMYVPTAAMLIKRNVFKSIGNFDETYFYGHEDTDFCWRAKIAGFKIYYEPSAIAHHHKNKTVNTMKKEVIYYGVRNRIRSLIKNHGTFNLIFYLPLYGLFSVSEIIIKSFRKERLSAWKWNISNLKDTLKQRKIIQMSRKIKDRELGFSSIFKVI